MSTKLKRKKSEELVASRKESGSGAKIKVTTLLDSELMNLVDEIVGMILLETGSLSSLDKNT